MTSEFSVVYESPMLYIKVYIPEANEAFSYFNLFKTTTTTVITTFIDPLSDTMAQSEWTTLVAIHLNKATTHTEKRISDQLQSGCVRELLQFHWDLRSVMTVGKSLQKYLQLFHLFLKLNQKVKSTSMPLHH